MTATGELLRGRFAAGATLLSSGQVLIAGGDFGIASAELYDPATGTWAATGSLNTGRGFFFSLTSLSNGTVLAAGGYLSGTGSLASAELYDPGIAVTATMASGRGSITGQGDTARFVFRANLGRNRPSGSLSFSDPAAGIAISRARVRTLTFGGNSADLSGTARMDDGNRVTYSVSVTDNGDGNTDTFSISLSNGYSAGGTLTSGDIRIQ